MIRRGRSELFISSDANCPDICPPTTYLMTQVQNQLKDKGTFGKDVEFTLDYIRSEA